MEVPHLLLCCFSLLLHPSVNNAQPYRNISLGSTLAGNSSWISPSGEFSFGFSVLGTSLYAGIRYEKIPGKPLVWTTNRDKPAPLGSTIELTSDGRFVLKDAKNTELSVIAAGSGVGNVSYAAMLDTGNLVLVGSTPSDYRWQSFDYPTNTILPTQNLALEYKLYAGFSPTNLSTGSHYVVMQTDGNFVGYTTALKEPTYASNTDGIPGKLMFDETGSLYILQAQKNTTINLTPLDKIPKPAKNFYHRATMDWDGVFRQYSYPKTTQNGEWTENWNVVWSTNRHPCVVKGMCGSNGYCVYGSGQDFSCSCPQGFSYIDPNQPVVGCRQDWKVMDCRSYDRGDYLLQTIDSVNWDGEYESLSVDESACREACLADCECVVAVYGGSSCNKKRMPMRNGGPVSDGGTKALIKVPRDNRTLVSPPPPSDGSGRGLNPSNTTSMENGRRHWISIAVATGSVLGSLNLILLVGCILLCIMWQKDRRWRQRSVFGPSKSGMQLTSFSYEELKKATDGFKEKLGGGSFGTVYKGFLNLGAGSGRKSVAVKQLDNKLVEEGEKEFRTEVSVIGRTHHKNLVKLHGFCDEGSHRLLVYEYMEQGSLSSFLFGSTRPEWNQRVKIATGIARGLMYLHEECETQIIHCDIKPGNILIDGNFVPKLADFGLAKLLRHDQTKTNTDIRGTKGYVAPEWFRKMAITVKVDVYSYGVMLLELICCRKNVNLADLDDPSAILVDWAYDCFVGKRLIKLVEDDEDAADDLRKVEKMVMVALWCIQEEPSLRPTMKKVTQMLEGAVEVAVPPSPSSFISSMG